MRRIPTEIFSQGRLEVAEEVFAPDYIEHVALLPGFPSDIAGFKQLVAARREAFPDLQYTIEDDLAADARVVQRHMVRGTHRSPFQGIPPTGRQVTWTEMHWVRCADGKHLDHWANIDQLGLLQQLGVIPAPGQAPA